MEMKKCENGHYYDASVNASCPYCDSAAGGATMPLAGGADSGKTMALGESYGGDSGKTLPLGGSYGGDSGKTLPLGGSYGGDSGKTLPLGGGDSGKTLPLVPQDKAAAGKSEYPDDDGRTVALIKKSIGIDPVVGWLVCVSGEEKGRDYRIHADNNFIGRSERMDICIRGDETISRENHAIISYDTVDQLFYFSPGDGRSIVRYNGKALFQTTELKSHDRIIIGKTELIFVPFCTEAFSWMEEADQ